MDYVAFFEQHINGLEKTGRGYLGCCRFHSDEGSKLKGFYLNPTNGLWKCFSCGEKGNAKQFCEKLGIEVPEDIQRESRSFYRGNIRDMKPKFRWEPGPFEEPPAKWQERAAQLVERAHK